ncbi:interferon a3-like isoform X1 [Tachysurus vachellii]|uniref:interferon a3-like isoform X1 n=1 Tax=Tachysurus vachellii TaxID=175792 RepID=UPI00296B0BE1|nr:interferon a3-like isoform X1 [Tachysurus vachellii]
MNTKQSWTCLYLLLFFSVQERSSACKWMTGQYRVKNDWCLSLLKEMGGEIITNNHQPFPDQAYIEIRKAKTEDQIRFLAEATEQIVSLFNILSDLDEVKQQKWDSKKLYTFLNILNYRQLKELEECTAEYGARVGRSSSERKVRRHFKKLKKILKKANYSAHSLELIRNVVMHHLMRMDIVAASVNGKLIKKTN